MNILFPYEILALYHVIGTAAVICTLGWDVPKHFISYHLFDTMLESREEHSFYKPPPSTQNNWRGFGIIHFINLGCLKNYYHLRCPNILETQIFQPFLPYKLHFQKSRWCNMGWGWLREFANHFVVKHFQVVPCHFVSCFFSPRINLY